MRVGVHGKMDRGEGFLLSTGSCLIPLSNYLICGRGTRIWFSEKDLDLWHASFYSAYKGKINISLVEVSIKVFTRWYMVPGSSREGISDLTFLFSRLPIFRIYALYLMAVPLNYGLFEKSLCDNAEDHEKTCSAATPYCATKGKSC